MNNETKPLRLPKSGLILGAVIEALDLPDEVLSSRTVRRFIQGKPVSEHSATELFVGLGKSLVDSGVIPVPPLFVKHDVSMPIIAGATIARMAARWDGLCAIIQSHSGRIRDTNTAAVGFLRLVVVDLALRMFALLRLAKLGAPEAEVPLWAEENGAGKLMRSLLAEAGLTREQLAARLGVSYTSVDNWLDGRIRPSHRNVELFAEEIGRLVKRASPTAIGIQVQQYWTFSTLADLLSHYIGREATVELAAALYKFVKLIMDDVEQMNRPPLDEVAGEEMLAFRHGSSHTSTHVLLRNLAMQVTDPGWKRDILAACGAWSIRFQEIANKCAMPESAAGLAQDMGFDEADEDIEKLVAVDLPIPAFTGTAPRLLLEQLATTLKHGLEDRRLIVRRHPGSAKAHFTLGSFLGMVAKYSGDESLLEEGLTECRIAAQMLPSWDAPRVELGIILGNVGHYGEALRELDGAASLLLSMTPHLANALGYVKMCLEDFAGAILAFEFVLEREPDYAFALDHAAHCYFMVGDKVNGARYSKKAHQLGESRTFLAWRRGAYRKHKKDR